MIIINADDFGISPEVNRAIVNCFEDGIISSTTIMMNMPYCEDAIKLAFEHGFNESVGLHFNMIEGEPLTTNIKGCERICTDGLFSYKRNSVKKWSRKEATAIVEEFEAQLNRMMEMGIKPSHIDSHEHTHTEIPIFNIIKKPILKADINRIRATRNVGLSKLRIIAKNVINCYFHIVGFKTTKYFNDITQQSINVKLDNLEIMCHPIMMNDTIVDSCRGIEIVKQFDNLSNYRNL
jgi:predicted glycoside hydrolase/deacetylase ChbG (UPF0249 family)